MTNEEMRIAIAEALGWRVVKDIYMCGFPPGLNNLGIIPDYPNDLNACYEMEESLGIDGPDYASELWRNIVAGNVMSDREAMWKLSHATASQRCEAFLRVNGLWMEETK